MPEVVPGWADQDRWAAGLTLQIVHSLTSQQQPPAEKQENAGI